MIKVRYPEFRSCPMQALSDGDGCAGKKSQEVECVNCILDSMCQLLDYAKADADLPEGILLRHKSVARGETIYRQEDPFRAVFAVKSGSFKNIIPETDGQEQVVGFCLPGELMGAEGMSEKLYPSTVRALEASHICELRVERLPESGRPLEVLQQRMIELLGGEIAFNRKLMATIARQSSEQRMAAFLLNLSQRYSSRGYAGHEFVLRMSWADIGSYLGLASETVSRVMSKFQKAGLLVLEKKCVTLLNTSGLKELVGGA